MASIEEIQNEAMRKFSTGATRNVDTERIDPEGFFSPVVVASFCDYMHKNRFQKDGKMRDSDNWQLGIPQKAYVKSLWRHFLDFWTIHRKQGNHLDTPSPYRNEKLVEDCQAMMFNVMGYLNEELKKPTKLEIDLLQSRGQVFHYNENCHGHVPQDTVLPLTHFDPSSIYPAMNRAAKERAQLLEDSHRDSGDEDGYGSGV